MERGQITSKGIEFGIIGNVTSNINVNINYTYTDAKITDDLNKVMIGFPNYGVAKNVFNGMIQYKFKKGKLNRLSLGAGVQYSGDVSVVWAGWTAPEDKFKTLPSYSIYDANIGYEFKRFSFNLNIYNLLNKRFITSGWWNSSDDPLKPGYYSGAMSTPLTFRFAVFYKI